MNSRMLGLLFVPWLLPVTFAADTGAQYKLAAGDVLRITVFGERDLSFEKIRLNDAGMFSYPFLGDIDRCISHLLADALPGFGRYTPPLPG